MGETGALARARGASELWGLCRAVKQGTWFGNVVEGSTKSGQERRGVAEGREGKGPGTPPRRCPHGGAHPEGVCETLLQPRWALAQAVGRERSGVREARLSVHCGAGTPRRSGKSRRGRRAGEN